MVTLTLGGGSRHGGSFRIVGQRLFAQYGVAGIKQRPVAIRIPPSGAIQAGNGGAQPVHVDRRSVSPLLGRNFVFDLDLVRCKQSRLGRLLTVGGEIDQLQEVGHFGNPVDCGFHDLDPRRPLMVVDANIAMCAYGGNLTSSVGAAHHGGCPRIDAGVTAGSFCQFVVLHAQQGATRAHPGAGRCGAIDRDAGQYLPGIDRRRIDEDRRQCFRCGLGQCRTAGAPFWFSGFNWGLCAIGFGSSYGWDTDIRSILAHAGTHFSRFHSPRAENL